MALIPHEPDAMATRYFYIIMASAVAFIAAAIVFTA